MQVICALKSYIGIPFVFVLLGLVIGICLFIDRAYYCVDSNSYTLVLHKHGDILYEGVSEAVAGKLAQMINGVVSTHADVLLERVVEVWDTHKLIMTMIRDILMYMVRNCVLM
jgi:hypothetical protein